MTVRERDIESKLRRVIEKYGGLFFKFVSPGNDGVPDRIAVLPDGQTWFIELKALSGRLSPIQEWQIDRLKAKGAKVAVIKGEQEAIDWWAERSYELVLEGYEL